MVKILVIDDELGIREGCKRALTPQGFEVDTAENGEQGLQKVQANGYALALLDVMMPGASGMEMLAAIHAHDPEIVCIIITGYATIELAVQAIKQGAYDFLTKPFTADDLLLAVNQGLERRRLSLETKRLQAIEQEARQLAADKARLEELDKAKVAFINLVTHELQAPASAVHNYLELVLGGYVSPPEQNAVLAKALERVKEQLALIADLLEFGRLREIKTLGTVSDVALDQVLREALESFQAEIARKGLQVQINIAESLPTIRGVAKQFASLWSNLIGNAIKYTPPGGRIEISLRHTSGKIVGQVRDSGIGIPTEALPKLFTEFFRASNAKELGLPGTGLGLAIVKQIVEKNGGQIQVESQVGQGTTFTFEIGANQPAGL